MKTILLDDEPYGLKGFEAECEGIDEIEIIGSFRNPEDALQTAREQRIDAAFLDVVMPEMSGLELSDELRKLYPDIVIIYVSAYREYITDAITGRGADYYLVKPYTAKEILSELDRARLLSVRQKKRVCVHTFGNFEVYLDGKPMKFTSGKAKEIFALLIDAAGESVTTEEAYTRIWEKNRYSYQCASNFRHALKKLRDTLTDAVVKEILQCFPHERSVRRDMIDCDYFDMLDGNPEAVKAWNGSYMEQYSWAEERKGTLFHIRKKLFSDTDDIWEL